MDDSALDDMDGYYGIDLEEIAEFQEVMPPQVRGSRDSGCGDLGEGFVDETEPIASSSGARNPMLESLLAPIGSLAAS